MADADSRTITEPTPGSFVDPLLTQFLVAGDRLSDEDRLRLVVESERLADTRPVAQ